MLKCIPVNSHYHFFVFGPAEGFNCLTYFLLSLRFAEASSEDESTGSYDDLSEGEEKNIVIHEPSIGDHASENILFMILE